METISSRPTTTATNTHAMKNRAKSGIHKPKGFLTTLDHSSIKEDMQIDEWKSTMLEELFALKRNNTWQLVNLPKGRQPISCKWIFRVKENADGTINKYEAHLVVNGFHQQAGFDFFKTFSPFVKPITI
ncbi:uncharacterized mitochondrial protein AtMg00820-like [Humulus lupulus]|uniref:uncharacterized mitochondrial protein AtMg00820-like n=1 Tax=Humulus lupulus TaxID=3486 RepID=UPI002B40F313|nr:uncharacterized mitochondrial protein AtMg00820-like [Humulus lupulus]